MRGLVQGVTPGRAGRGPGTAGPPPGAPLWPVQLGPAAAETFTEAEGEALANTLPHDS